MYLIEPKRNGKWQYDPGLAMALQEYVKDYIFLDDDVLFIYTVQPSVQIGKYQNAYEEVNQTYMDAHNIKIVRRETGGGAIYLDDQNMNFCFLFNGNHDVYDNYKRLYEPVINALKKLGVPLLEQKGRNDLILADKKISGAAMTLDNGRIYAGYSLLLDPNYEAMLAVLNPNQKKISAHGIQSIRSRVGAIRPYLAPEYQEMTVWEFTDFILTQLLNIDNIQEAKRYKLTKRDWEIIDKIAAEKYNNWDWNYGRFPQFDYNLSKRFSIGTIHIGLEISRAKISAINITGDFFGEKDVKEVEKLLTDVRLKKESLLDALNSINLADYFGDLTKEEFVHFILDGS